MKKLNLKLRSMTWRRSYSGLFGLAILLAVRAFATDYYVDPTNGNDANNGTSSSTPWKTVAKVNSSMPIFAPGDRILFKRGETFTGTGLVIRKGGAPGNPLVFGAYGTGNKPLFSGYSTESAIITEAANMSDIILEDIAVSNVSGSGNMGIGFAANNNNNVTIRRCDVEAVGHAGILIMCVDGYLVENCTVRNCGNAGIAVIGDRTYPATNGVIRNCIVDGVTDNDGITLHTGDTPECNLGPNHLIENNICSNCGEQGIDITAGTDIVLRGNETFGNGHSSIVIAWYVKRVWVDKHYSHDDPSRGLYILDSEDVKVTRSIVVNGIGWILDIENCRNFEAYDNTFVRTANSTHLGFAAIAGTCQGIKLKNNILVSYHNVNPGGFFSYFSGATRQNTGCDFSNNCYWRNNLYLDLSGESGSFVANPELKNDFSLEAYSPCIDAGIDVGLNEDLFGTRIPQGLAPDIGVAEYKATGSLSASASASPTSGTAPLIVYFNASTSNGVPPYTYSWNFGDGQSSAQKSPSHTYNNGGNYAATVTVTDSASATASSTVNVNVTANSALRANIVASPTSGQAPLNVNFTGSATGGASPYSYRWSFGDGSSSTAQNPSHTYSIAGSYTAILTVTDSLSATNSNSLTINVTAAASQLTATASANPASGQAPLTVNFAGSASGGTAPYTYSWTFGDGGSAAIQNPSHTYSAMGTYSVTLSITDSRSANANAIISITVLSTSDANLALSAVTGAPAPGEGGTTEPSPGNHSFSLGSTIQVKSVPNTDYRFSKWTGDITEANIFSPATTLLMNNSKSLSATFCTKCADVNGDLKVTPGDAQLAFDIYLGKIADLTWCELENADVNGSGTRLTPKVTPADAQEIFHKFIRRGVTSTNCSGSSRATTLSKQNTGFRNVNITINNMSVAPGQDILIPIIIESPSEIMAFGFDLAFPSDVLTYIGLESTELTKNYEQLDANVISYGTTNLVRTITEPMGSIFSRFSTVSDRDILMPQAIDGRETASDFDKPAPNMMDNKILRVGGYKTNSEQNPSSGVLVTLVFRVEGEFSEQDEISIIAAYDDIQDATFRNEIISPNSRKSGTDFKSPGGQIETKYLGKRYDF